MGANAVDLSATQLQATLWAPVLSFPPTKILKVQVFHWILAVQVVMACQAVNACCLSKSQRQLQTCTNRKGAGDAGCCLQQLYQQDGCERRRGPSLRVRCLVQKRVDTNHRAPLTGLNVNATQLSVFYSPQNGTRFFFTSEPNRIPHFNVNQSITKSFYMC